MSTKKIQILNSSFVSYNEQNLTDEQKAQARANIGVEIPSIDDSLNSESTNPVQNKVIYDALAEKQPVGDYALKSDVQIATDAIEENNSNPVSSNAVYLAFSNIKTITSEEINAICGSTIYRADEEVL